MLPAGLVGPAREAKLEVVSFLVAAVAVVVSFQALLVLAAIGAMLFAIVPALVGWIGSKMFGGFLLPLEWPTNRHVVNIPLVKQQGE
jgi:hypothetical protein